MASDEKTVHFDEENILARRARKKGLELNVDKFDCYYLQIPKEKRPGLREGLIDLDPYIVFMSRDLLEVDYFLKTHSPPFRTLTPAEVLGPIIGDGDEIE